MSYTLDKPLRLCVFGAGPGTGNLGVSALMFLSALGLALWVKLPLEKPGR